MHSHGLGSCHCPPTSDAAPQKLRALWFALGLVTGLASIELWVSHHSHSLSLMADAGHLVADVFAIAMSLLAAWIAQWPATDRAPFGYRRIEILAALANGVGLVVIALWLGQAAVTQLQQQPTEILTQPMVLTAALGLGVNGLNAILLHRHADNDLNLRAAFLHVLVDAASCLGVLGVAITINQYHWLWADGVMSLAIVGLILTGAIPLIRQSVRILLEQSPAELDVASIRAYLLAQPEITDVTQLQIWSITPGQTYLSAHLSVTLPNGLQRDRLLHKLQADLQTFSQSCPIQAVTLQMVTAPEIALSTLPSTKIRELIQSDLSTLGATPTHPV